jgi:hypothetical protein
MPKRTAAVSAYPDALIPLDHLARAEEFFQAFKDLPKRTPPSWPRYFLLCHAIELALKAFLTRQGVTMRRLKQLDLRHDLENLLREAISSGLALGPLARSEIELLTAR